MVLTREMAVSQQKKGDQRREVPVPIRMKSLVFWIGEKIKMARTRVLMAFLESERV